MLRRLAATSLLVVAATLALASSASALDIADATPVEGTVGVPYSYTFSLSPGSGSPGASWSISSGALPPGLSLSSNDRTALVYGTPTQAGTFRFYVMVRDAPGPWICCTEEEFVITIIDALSITAGSDLPVGNMGQAYGYQLATSGGTAKSWSVSAGTLPSGVQLTPEGAIVGTPTQSAVSQFTVRATDGSRAATKQFTLKVTEPMLVTAPKPTAIKLGRQFLVMFGVKGGLGPYTWSGLDLPTGVGVNPTSGQLGGRPGTAGQLTYTVKVTDSLGASLTATASILAAGMPSIGTKSLPAAHAGKRFNARIVASGGAGSLRVRLGRDAPAWLHVDEHTGVLSGTPKLVKAKVVKGGKGHTKWVKAKPVTYSVHVTAFDALGQRVTTKLSLTVRP